MIVIVTPEDAPRYKALLEEAYRFRHRIFAEERGWLSFRKPDGLERDAADPDGSISFICVRDGKVVGNARLVPGGGMNPELVTPEKTAALEARSPFTGLGRFSVAPELRGGPKAMSLGAHLLLAVLEYCRDHAIKEVFFETDPWFIMLLRVLKVRVETVGPPMPYFGRQMQMGIVPINEHTIEKARGMLRLERKILPQHMHF